MNAGWNFDTLGFYLYDGILPYLHNTSTDTRSNAKSILGSKFWVGPVLRCRGRNHCSYFTSAQPLKKQCSPHWKLVPPVPNPLLVAPKSLLYLRAPDGTTPAPIPIGLGIRWRIRLARRE